MTKKTSPLLDAAPDLGPSALCNSISSGPAEHVIVLNEFTLFVVISLRMNSRVPYLFGINPVFPPSAFILRFAARMMQRAGWIRDIAEIHESAAAAKMRAPLFPSKDWFGRTEKIFISQLGLDERSPDQDYDYAACKQAVNMGAAQLRVVHFIHELNCAAPDLRLILHGCGRETAAVHQLVSQCPDKALCLPHRYPRRLLNSVLTVLAAFSAIFKVVSQIRLRPVQRRRVLLAIDVIDNLDRMVPTVNDILDDVETQALYVFRNKRSYQLLKKGLSAYPICAFPDGQFGLVDAVKTMACAITDCAKLYQHFGAVDSELFLQIVKLSAVRVHFKALLNKYDIAHFWGRDEYNAEHIIRSQELRRRGGKSVGLINGVNVFGVDSVFRYVDYDLTFVFSPGPYLKYNGDNWRRPENVRQIGAIGLGRTEIREMLRDGKTNDIVCFAKTYCDGPEFLDQVFKLGRAFSDRNVFISLKKSATRLGGGDEFNAYLENAPKNVTLVDASSFQLIKKCRYVISGESSILSEAINLGSISFFLDTYTDEEVFVYREYPFLSHRDGQTVIDLIRRIENGTWEYPVGTYADLADLSGVSAFDTFRGAIGLPTRDPPVLAKLWPDRGLPPAGSEESRGEPAIELRQRPS